MASNAQAVAAGLRAICGTDDTFRKEMFLGHARRLFLRYHRATATGDSSDIRPFLGMGIRRNLDAEVGESVRIAPVSSVRSARIIEAEDADVDGERIVVRFVAVDTEQQQGVLAEDWVFDRSADVARWVGRDDHTKCPSCGADRTQGAEVCEYCGAPLVGGGWIVTDISTVAVPESNVPRVATMAAFAAGLLAVAIVVVFMAISADDSEIDDARAEAGVGSGEVASDSSAEEGTGVAGHASIVLTGATDQTRSAQGKTVGGSDSCDDVAHFSGFAIVGEPGGSSVGSVTVAALAPEPLAGPGLYDVDRPPQVSVSYQRSGGDGIAADNQSWSAGSDSTTVLEIAPNGNMTLTFTELRPTKRADDEMLNGALSGTVSFTCAG